MSTATQARGGRRRVRVVAPIGAAVVLLTAGVVVAWTSRTPAVPPGSSASAPGSRAHQGVGPGRLAHPGRRLHPAGPLHCQVTGRREHGRRRQV